LAAFGAALRAFTVDVAPLRAPFGAGALTRLPPPAFRFLAIALLGCFPRKTRFLLKGE
jgi:hypothetical protein